MMNSPLTLQAAAQELLIRRKARASVLHYANAIDIPGRPVGEDPDTEFFEPIETTMAPHHRLILETMDRISKTPHGRAMFFMPPGSAKSTYASVVFPTRYLGAEPGRKIILASYGDDLARKMGRRTRSIIKQKRYRQIFNAEIAGDSAAAQEFALTNGSEYMACGIMSGVTGNRCHGLIIDDPVKNREQADSLVVQEKTFAEYDESLKTRLIPGGWIVIIQTRWNENDLAGRILPESWKGESGPILCRDGNVWEVVCLQARCEIDNDPLGRKIGEYLWPEWFDEKHWAQFQNSPRSWSALYQQLPRPLEGTLFSIDSLLQDGQPVEYPERCDQVFAVLDTALKDGLEHDGTAVTYYARNKIAGHPLVILDWDLIQIEAALLDDWLPSVNQRLEHFAKLTKAREGNSGMWIEDKASGIVLLQQAARRGLPAYPIDNELVAQGKEGRALSVMGHVYVGKVKLSRHAYDKVSEFKGQTRNHLTSQVCGFRPGAKTPHQYDLLDTFTYGVAISLGDSEGW
jgi:hypothetical protein